MFLEEAPKTILPTWAANTIVLVILVIVFGFIIGYMIYKHKKGAHFGCDCGSGTARSLKRHYKKDFKAHKEKEKANKEESCSCCSCKDEEK